MPFHDIIFQVKHLSVTHDFFKIINGSIQIPFFNLSLKISSFLLIKFNNINYHEYDV